MIDPTLSRLLWAIILAGLVGGAAAVAYGWSMKDKSPEDDPLLALWRRLFRR